MIRLGHFNFFTKKKKNRVSIEGSLLPTLLQVGTPLVEGVLKKNAMDQKRGPAVLEGASIFVFKRVPVLLRRLFQEGWSY